MSIRTNSMKAVPRLLKHLTNIKSMEADTPIGEKLENLESELTNIKDLFSRVKKNQEELLDTLTQVDVLLRSFNLKDSKHGSYNQKKPKELELENICKNIKDSTQKLQPLGAATTAGGPNKAKDRTMSQDQDDEKEEDKSEITLKELPLDDILKMIWVSYYKLNLCSRLCLLYLSIFPENAVIMKRHTIYWWIAEGFVKGTENKSPEQVGEDVFDELWSCNLIVPQGNGKCPIVNKFKINPLIRHMLVTLVLREKDQLFGYYSGVRASNTPYACLVFDQPKVKINNEEVGLRVENLRTVFNVGARYLNFGSRWMDKVKDLVVLQLGRWQDSPWHHIEVESGDFLNNLKAQKHLKYLSLRGISRISELPGSIVEIVSLEILDLKACHNLEKLPSNIAALKRLTHLDVSQCYLLESMPKGIEKLDELQVLKGFVIGSSSKTPCRISDLARLKKLTRLSIHIGSEAVITQEKEFESLKDFSKVKRLKISWGVSTTRYYKSFKNLQIQFPPRLNKLVLEGFPGEEIPEWLKPSKLPKSLKQLYIKGGLFTSMAHGETGNECSVEIVRLKYLKHLKTEPNLRELFPSLSYEERK